MRIRVRFFASARIAAGQAERELEMQPPATAGDALARLERDHPALRELRPSLKLAVREAVVSPEHALEEGDTLALLPPVSGGSGAPLPSGPLRSERALVTPEPIRLEELAEEMAGRGEGALATFTGIVRPYEDRCGPVESLEYEIYPEMAIRTLEQVCQESQERFPILGIRVAHRFGPVPAGEAAVAIAVCAEHRAAAFDACRFAIDRIKEIVPIWKLRGREDAPRRRGEHRE